jgi:predicted ATP-grasp superfamily ATP-dependent carboligase
MLPLHADLAHRAVAVARSGIDALPDLGGYVGADVVLGEANDGSTDWLIEINPRLTTSYLGLRALAEGNLAQLLVRVARGEQTAAPRWRPGPVRFLADGTILPTEHE